MLRKLRSKLESAQMARGEQKVVLRPGEKVITLEEFEKRLSVPNRKWRILGGKTARKTGCGRGNSNNLTNALIGRPTVTTYSGEDGRQILNLPLMRGRWSGGPFRTLHFHTDFFIFTSRSKKHLGIRFANGEYAGWTALTLIDEKTVEEEREEAERTYELARREIMRKKAEEMTKKLQDELQQFFAGLPIKFEISNGYNDEGFGKLKLTPSTIKITRTDTGVILRSTVADPFGGPPHHSFSIHEDKK